MTLRGRRARKTQDSVDHIYTDADVTPDRLRSFALAPYQEQVQTLATLRAAQADESNAVSLGFGGIAAAFLIALTVPATPFVSGRQIDTVLEWVSVLAVSVVLALVVLVALSPAMFLSARDANRRERAIVWLAAFEDELERHRRRRGRAARQWRRTH